jgi:hypothetical protein
MICVPREERRRGLQRAAKIERAPIADVSGSISPTWERVTSPHACRAITAFPPSASVAGCDRTAERPLDCRSIDRSLRLATGARIYRSRSGLRLWRADLAPVTMAKRVFREAHRFDPIRSDGIALTILLCSASGISDICSIPTKNITTRLVHTYRCARTCRSRAPSSLSVARWRCQVVSGAVTPHS